MSTEQPLLFQQVRNCANEFAWQVAWSRKEKHENKSLAVSRVWLEWSQAQYRVLCRKVFR